jgi:hypothetical protein
MSRTFRLLLAIIAAAGCLHADGKLDQASKEPWNAARNTFDEMIKYLDSGNQIEARSSAEKFHKQLNSLFELVDATVTIAQLDEKDREVLKPFYAPMDQALHQCMTFTGVLKDRIGRERIDSNVSQLKEYWVKYNQAFTVFYANFVDYGKKLNERLTKVLRVCESCK